MTIEEALRQIADNEPVVASEMNGDPFCVYCTGDTRVMVWTTGRSEFIHEDDCPWVYLKKTVEEDRRIEAELRARYPGYAVHFVKHITASRNLEDI